MTGWLLTLVACGAPEPRPRPADSPAQPTSDSTTPHPSDSQPTSGPLSDSAAHTAATGLALASDTGALSDTARTTDTTVPSDTFPQTTTTDTADTGIDTVSDTALCLREAYQPECGRLDWAVHLHSRAVDHLAEVALAPDGTIVIGGWMMRDMVFGEGQANETTVQPLCGGRDAPFLARYHTDGTLLWARRVADACAYTRIETLEVTADNSIVVSGLYWGDTTFGAGTPNEVVLPEDPEVSTNLFFARYDAGGEVLWAKHASGGFLEHAKSSTVSLDGQRYTFTGEFRRDLVFEPKTPSEVRFDAHDFDTPEAYVVSYHQDGSLAWAKSVYSALGRATGYSVGPSTAGPWVTVDGAQPVVFGEGEPNETEVSGPRETHVALGVFGINDGSLVSARTVGGVYATDIIRYDQINLLVGITSSTAGAVFAPGLPNEVTLPPSAFYLAAFEDDTNFRWVVAPEEAGSQFTSKVAALDDTIAVAAGFQVKVDFGCDGPQFDATDDSREAFVATYDGQGTFRCAWMMTGTRTQDATGVAVDPDGGIIAAGLFLDDITIAAGTPYAVSFTADNASQDLWLARFAP